MKVSRSADRRNGVFEISALRFIAPETPTPRPNLDVDPAPSPRSFNHNGQSLEEHLRIHKERNDVAAGDRRQCALQSQFFSR
jgi:hypothetical protein